MKLFASLLLFCLLELSTLAANPLLGTTGPHPHDADKTHALIRTIPATYYNSDFKASIWENGSDKGRAYYDRQYALGSHCRQIWTCEIPIADVPKIVPQIVARYNLWALGPINENPKWTEVAAMVAAFRKAAPSQRLIGPNFWEPFHPNYYKELIPTIKLLDVLSFHDYKACPGGGTAPKPPWPTKYCHPYDELPPFEGFTEKRPDLTGRIKWLQGFCKYLRKDAEAPDLICTEYGIYVNDPRDAWAAAMVFKASNVPVCVWTPHSPANRSNSVPYGNGIYDAAGNGSWSEAMQMFLKAMN